MTVDPRGDGFSIPHSGKSKLKSFVMEAITVRPVPQVRNGASGALGRRTADVAAPLLALAGFQQRLQVRHRLLVADHLRLGRARLRRLARGRMPSRVRLARQLHGAPGQPVVTEAGTRDVG